MSLISEKVKVDVALATQSLNGAGTTAYFSLANYGRALFTVVLGAMAAAATSVLQVMQATSATGAVNKAVTNNTATVTANVHVAVATLVAAAVQVGDAVTVNGLTYTGAAAANLPQRVYLSNPADNNATAASLAAAINHATAGVPGVTAAAVNATVTLTATEPGEADVTITNPAATLTAATVQAIGYVECEAGFLDTANGFTHVALSVTNSAAMNTGVAIVRGDARYTPVQHVAAAKTDVEV